MKHALPALLLLATVTTGQAQLVNGSFEIDGQPSLEGWNNSCGEAVLLPGGAPGAGDWHVGYPTLRYNQDFCGEAMFDVLFQEIPTTSLSTEWVTIGFWSRTNTAPTTMYFMYVETRISFASNGVFSPQFSTGTGAGPSTDWTYNVVECMMYPFHPEEPRAIGFSGYDTSATGLLELDEIEILSIAEAPTAISSIEPAKVLGYYDPMIEAIVISKPLDSALLCFDASGRSVEVPLTGSRNGARTFATASLSPGIYTAVSGKRSLRFFKQ